jgi:sulfonate transport system substrate-binding protein
MTDALSPPPRTRLWLVIGLAALLLAVVLGAWLLNRPAADARPVLRVGSQRGSTKALLTASGVLDRLPYRIEWSEFPAAQNLLEAISADAVDVGTVGDAPFLFAYAAGAPIKVVSVAQSGSDGALNAILVRADSPIRTLADLRGKKIATGRISVGHYSLLRFLEKAGLKPTDVTISFLPPGDAKAAFNSGAVDAWCTWTTYVATAVVKDHARILADANGLVTGQAFQAASESAIAARRPQLQDFVVRLGNAYRWAKLHPDLYADALVKDTGIPLDVARYVTSRQKLMPVPIDARVIAEERQVLNHFAAAGAITTTRKLEDAFDPSFRR